MSDSEQREIAETLFEQKQDREHLKDAIRLEEARRAAVVKNLYRLRAVRLEPKCDIQHKKQLGARLKSGAGRRHPCNAWLILCTEALERCRNATAFGRLGALLDRDDISDNVYQKANAEYDALFEAATSRSVALHDMIIRYVETMWAEAQQNAACNAIHDASSRLCHLQKSSSPAPNLNVFSFSYSSFSFPSIS